MIKFSREEALQIIKAARQLNLGQRRQRALKKIAKMIEDGSMEKQGIALATIALIASLIASIGAAGYEGYSAYKTRGELEDMRKRMEEQQTQALEQQRKDVQEGVKKLRPRIFVATPKQQAPQQPATPKPMPMGETPGQLPDFEKLLAQFRQPSMSQAAGTGAFMDQKEKSPAEMMQESLDKPTWGHLPWGTGEGSPFADKISADMSKKAGAYDKAVMALLKVLSAARKAKGVAATAGGAVARGVGAAGAGAKWGLGKVFSKMPGTFLKSTGKQMVANTSPYFAGGTAGGQMILPGMSSYMQKELGKKLLGRTAKTFLHPFGIGNLFVWSPYGYAINKVTGEPAEMDENGNLSEDDIAQAQQMMAWLEANRGGSLKPFVPQNVAMQLPDYDITEIPGGFDVPDTIPDQAGLPKVQGPGQEVGLNDQDGGVA